MPTASRHHRGFTLIELMVTLTVVIVLLLLALPSFESQRQRSALRGAAEQALGFWNQARLEAAKRNTLVKVGVLSNGNGYCLGATTTTPTSGTACDCFETDPTVTATFCNVARFPTDQAQWRSVTLTGTPTFGASGVAVIEPKRTSLVTSADEGNIGFNGPAGRLAYRINLHVDQFGRAVLCESKAPGIATMSDYGTRRCDD